MKFLSRLILILSLLAPTAAPAQDVESVFRDYAHMREVLDGLVKKRQIADVMRAFGASDEMTKEELANLEQRVRAIFKTDFENVDMLRKIDMGNGWNHELYAYWTGLSYLYVSVLYHQRTNELVAINFKFNTEYDELIVEF